MFVERDKYEEYGSILQSFLCFKTKVSTNFLSIKLNLL